MTPVTARSSRMWIGLSLVLFVTAALVLPFVGPTTLDFANVWAQQEPDWSIVTRLRASRTILGLVAGGALALAGSLFQSMLRDALATPYTLGVSAGASLGAMVAITFGSAWAIGGVATASLAGAFLAVAIVYALAAARHRGLSTTVMLLAGVTLNAFFSALILFVQYVSDFAQTYRALRWLMGDLDVASYEPILYALPLIGVAFAGFAWLARPLNLMSAGIDAAATRGVEVERVQRGAFFAASLATGAAVSVGGPIGFVGIIVPHLVRLIVGADHRLVLPASTFFGAAFLVGCDVVARTALSPLELPVGVITAILGGPFFLWLLLKKH